MTTIREIAEELNRRAKGYEIGKLQDIRKELKQFSRRPRRDIFSSQSIQESFAFHHGGRKELQFNVGWDWAGREKYLRHCVAFSLETSRSLPDITLLIPKITRFNEFIRIHTRELADFRMWHYDKRRGRNSERVGDYPVREIPQDLVDSPVFIAIGCLGSAEIPDYERILRDFDRLLPLYKFVEGEDSFPSTYSLV